MRPRPHIWKRWITSLWNRIDSFFSPCSYRAPIRWFVFEKNRARKWHDYRIIAFKMFSVHAKTKCVFESVFEKLRLGRDWLVYTVVGLTVEDLRFQHFSGVLIAQNGYKYYFPSRLSILQPTIRSILSWLSLVFTWTHPKEFWMRPKKKRFGFPLDMTQLDTWEEWKETGCLIDTIFIDDLYPPTIFYFILWRTFKQLCLPSAC